MKKIKFDQAFIFKCTECNHENIVRSTPLEWTHEDKIEKFAESAGISYYNVDVSSDAFKSFSGEFIPVEVECDRCGSQFIDEEADYEDYLEAKKQVLAGQTPADNYLWFNKTTNEVLSEDEKEAIRSFLRSSKED